MSKQDLTDWLIDHGRYILTIRQGLYKINLYAVNGEYWEIFFNVELNKITRVGKVTAHGMNKFIGLIKL